MKTSVCSRTEGYSDVPLVVFPVRNHPTPEAHAASLRACAARYLPRVGSMLFRGFGILCAEDFMRFAAAFGASVELVTAEASQRQPRGRLWVACTGSSYVVALADDREIRSQLSVAARKVLLEQGIRETDFGALLQQPPTALAPEVIAEIATAYEACAIRVDWEPGDVLLVDRARMTLSGPTGRACQLEFAVDHSREPSPIS